MILWLAVPAASGQPPQPATPHHATSSSSDKSDTDCRIHPVTTLPGSHKFASDYIETLATDPTSSDPNEIWALTADLSTDVPSQSRAMYISRSTDGGATWTQAARIDSRYFNAKIGEGIRNGLLVLPGAASFILTTQRGAFVIVPQPNPAEPLVQLLPGPRVPASPPKIPIAKQPGDPVRANAVEMTADGRHLIIGYGYFDLEPQIVTYRRENNQTDGAWVQDTRISGLPTDLDILSMQFDEPANPNPGFLYVGTGDQAFLFDRHRRTWSRIEGVGPDSAIHGMSVVGGLHLAACWGVYNPSGPGSVRRITTDSFLIHRTTDDAGSNIRAYSIDVDPTNLDREVISSLTGVYTTSDRGDTWRRINDLPDEEFRTAHFTSNGTVLVSGIAGTFLVNPFSDACSPQLKTRDK
jgi:hypothetical protein